MSERWQTTVSELVSVFRQAMVALLPTMERAHIAWRESDSYDDWDEITQALYRNIVGRSLAHSSQEEADLDTILPSYNTIHDSYADRSFLLVGHEGKPGVFVGLSTGEQPFDTVDYLPLGSDGRPVDSECQHARLDEVRLSFLRAGGSEATAIEELAVEI